MEFFQTDFITNVTIFLMTLSVVAQIIIGVLFQSMILETDNMTATENKLLKQCKLKFANCYQMNDGMTNVSAFVDKFINRIKIGCFTFSGLSALSGQMVLLAVFIAGIGIYRKIVSGAGIMDLLPYYIVSLFGLYVYFSVTSLVDARAKRTTLKTNIVDYLENHMVNRLQVLPKDAVLKEFPIQENVERSRKRKFGGKEQIELEQLLQEFLS